MGDPSIVEVEGRWLCCWSCDAVDHMAKSCPDKRPAPTSNPTLVVDPEEVVGSEESSQAPSEWPTVVRRGTKITTPPAQQETTSSTK